MELTGKCKKDFEKWLDFNPKLKPLITIFDRFTLSMQCGVLVDFFDSVHIYINHDTSCNRTESGSVEEIVFSFEIMSNKGIYSSYCFDGNRPIEYKTRQESIEKSITKANEIHNK